jgi:hypothetical protein
MRFSYQPPAGGGPAVPVLYLHWAFLSFSPIERFEFSKSFENSTIVAD